MKRLWKAINWSYAAGGESKEFRMLLQMKPFSEIISVCGAGRRRKVRRAGLSSVGNAGENNRDFVSVELREPFNTVVLCFDFIK